MKYPSRIVKTRQKSRIPIRVEQSHNSHWYEDLKTKGECMRVYIKAWLLGKRNQQSMLKSVKWEY